MDPNAFMMGGGMPQAQMAGMQRPNPGNQNEQIFAKVLDDMRKNPVPQGGWQPTMDIRERANYVMQL